VIHEISGLELTIGEKRLLPSFENAIVEMNKGDTKTVSIFPENAFGHRKEDLIFHVERSRIPISPIIIFPAFK
jgi:peptidylprolyl isomerase